MAQEKTRSTVRLIVRHPHIGDRPLYLRPELVAGIHKDPDGRAVITVAGHNMTVAIPGLREQMHVGIKGGAGEQEFWTVNFVKVAELLGFEVAQADRPKETAKKAEEIKEPGKQK